MEDENETQSRASSNNTNNNSSSNSNNNRGQIKRTYQFSAVYLAAGLSSRFGYRIKCLQEVGRYGETLFELSVRQLKHYGVHDLIIVVSQGTYELIHNLVGDNFMGLPVQYCFQVTPAWRKKPLGTVHAMLAAKPLVTKPFIVLNGDTLYGEGALSKVCAHVATQNNPCMPGYPLKDVLPESGKVNRAIIKIEGSRLAEIVEHYGVCIDDIKEGRYSGNELTSMNIFGFQTGIFEFAQRKFDKWLQENREEDTKEYILSTMLNDLLPEEGIRTSVYGCDNSIPLELTNPEDFAFVRNHLDLVGL